MIFFIVLFILFLVLKGKKKPERKYLTDYIDASGIMRSPSASNVALKQYAKLMSDAKPQALFIDDEVCKLYYSYIV